MKNKAVLPFEQDGDFFHKRAVMKADRQSYLEAVGFLRRALEKEPNNSQYLLDLADIFARMNCYDESNRILVSIMRMGEATSECFFGMGCNFYALKQYARAKEAFLTYNHLDPEGEFAEAVEDLIDELDEMSEMEPDRKVSAIAQRGGRALDEGDYRLAVRLLARAVKREPELAFIRNNLALALYCLGDVEKAAREAAIVLAAEPDNLHANCNMAMFLYEKNHRAQSMVHIKRAMDSQPEDVDDLTKICLTLCEMERDKDAYKYLKKLLRLRPYDKAALHQCAVACFNLGNYQGAIAAWDRARRIDPFSPVPPYCIGKAREALDGGEAERMAYSDQLPAQEVRRRISEFARNLGGSREEFAQRFEQDISFRELVRWGLGVSDQTFRKTALKLLSFMGGPLAEEMLREFLMRPDEGEEVKRDVMSCLKDIGAKEPYVAVLGGAVVEVRVSVFSSDRVLTELQRQVVQLAIEGLPFDEEANRLERERAVEELVALWLRFLGRQNNFRVRKPANWAAALVCVYCDNAGRKVDHQALCRRYDILPRALNTCLRTLRDGLSDQEAEG